MVIPLCSSSSRTLNCIDEVVVDVDGGRGGRVSVGAYVCRVVMVVERGCYWGEKEQKKKNHCRPVHTHKLV